MKFNYIDLFAGCGGLSLGLYNAKWKGILAIEKSPDAFKTLEYNLINNKKHFNWPAWFPKQAHDINEVIATYEEQLKSLRGTVDLVAGGPPCQGFSMAGRRNEQDERNQLINSYIKFVDLVQPKVIFFENVKGFTLKFQKYKGEGIAYSQMVLDNLNALGYDVHSQLINFSDYGVPQRRTRFILVGIKKDLLLSNHYQAKDFFTLLSEQRVKFLTAKQLPLQNTVEDALSDLLQEHGLTDSIDSPSFKSSHYGKAQSPYQIYIKNNVLLTYPDSHRHPNHQPQTIKKFKDILTLSMDRRNLDISKAIREKFNIKKHTIISLAADKPSPTITTLPDDYIHYKEPRILTVREYARLQSFPDWYQFKGKYTTGGKLRKQEVPRYSQIGNAIPPLFAEQAGIILQKILK